MEKKNKWLVGGISAVGGAGIIAGIVLGAKSCHNDSKKTYPDVKDVIQGKSAIEIVTHIKKTESVWKEEKGVAFDRSIAKQLRMKDNSFKPDYTNFEYRMDHTTVAAGDDGKGTGKITIKAYKYGHAPDFKLPNLTVDGDTTSTTHSAPPIPASDTSNETNKAGKKIILDHWKIVDVKVDFITEDEAVEKIDNTLKLVKDALEKKMKSTTNPTGKEYIDVPVPVENKTTLEPLSNVVASAFGMEMPQGVGEDKLPVSVVTPPTDEDHKAQIALYPAGTKLNTKGQPVDSKGKIAKPLINNININSGIEGIEIPPSSEVKTKDGHKAQLPGDPKVETTPLGKYNAAVKKYNNALTHTNREAMKEALKEIKEAKSTGQEMIEKHLFSHTIAKHHASCNHNSKSGQ